MPTAAGEWSFGVDHPWYTKSRYFAAAGITLDYAHNPLVFGTRSGSSFTEEQAVIAHQLLGHLDLSASFLDRVNISLSLPIVFLERGTETAGVSPGSAGVGDLRIGLMVRLYGQPYRDAFSIHLGGQVFAPTGTSNHFGDSGVSALAPKLALGGLSHRVLWSFTGAFFYRPEAAIGSLPAGDGNSVGPEFRFGLAVGYMDFERRFAIGPELLLATVVTDGHAFTKDFTSLEILGAAHYNIARQVQVGVAAGAGVLREPGTPDFRVLARLAYAPMARLVPKVVPADRDRDGIPDVEDACPTEPGPRSSDPKLNGCPLPKDRDGDGVLDTEDLCPDEPMGTHPDRNRRGCPDHDSDSDGVFDSFDECPAEPAGPHPDPARHGCPAPDTDKDGVVDPDDVCVDVPAGPNPDPERPGCPAPDRDADHVPDAVDACPDKPGVPDLDPKKNGCPSLVTLERGQIVILQQVFFATNKDTILPKSFPVLQAVVDLLKAKPDVKRVAVEGHTDNKGKPEKNLGLSDRRAKSVMRWIVEHGIDAARLEAHGYGQEKPIDSNKTEVGRAKNRRVEFHILSEGEPSR